MKKMKVISDYENNWGNCDPIKGNLILGNTYEVNKIKEHDWYTEISLKEVPNKTFNSVHFEEVRDLKCNNKFKINKGG
jgi:hypothetical protein